MHLEIITPDKSLFNGEVESVILPGSKGSFQVLKNHAALISSLMEGKIKYKVGSGGEHIIVIRKGMVEVLKNNVIVLVESLADAEEKKK